MKKQFLIIIIGLTIFALGVSLWFYFSKEPKEKEKPEGLKEKSEELKEGSEELEEGEITSEVKTSFGAEVIEKIGENPAAKMPEINPFKEEINPLEGVYKNPFE